MAQARTVRAARGLVAVLGALPVVVTVRDCVADVAYCQGVSMQPAINPYPDAATLRRFYFARYWRDWVLVDKVAPRYGALARGEVVLLRSVQHPDRLLLKRLAALEGDWVVTSRGDYVHIPRGHCWVEGDNRSDSIDSNSFGAVPLGVVTGRATHVVWPPWRVGRIAPRSDQGVATAELERRRLRDRPFQLDLPDAPPEWPDVAPAERRDRSGGTEQSDGTAGPLGLAEPDKRRDQGEVEGTPRGEDSSTRSTHSRHDTRADLVDSLGGRSPVNTITRGGGGGEDADDSEVGSLPMEPHGGAPGEARPPDGPAGAGAEPSAEKMKPNVSGRDDIYMTEEELDAIIRSIREETAQRLRKHHSAAPSKEL
jgi:inner membrane protease subunit 2